MEVEGERDLIGSNKSLEDKVESSGFRMSARVWDLKTYTRASPARGAQIKYFRSLI